MIWLIISMGANLYKQMVRVAKEKQPKVIIAENVKGLLTLHGGSIIAKIIKAFEDAGYVVEKKLIRCADFGVPQKRERVIIVCIRKDIAKKMLADLNKTLKQSGIELKFTTSTLNYLHHHSYLKVLSSPILVWKLNYNHYSDKHLKFFDEQFPLLLLL